VEKERRERAENRGEREEETEEWRNSGRRNKRDGKYEGTERTEGEIFEGNGGRRGGKEEEPTVNAWFIYGTSRELISEISSVKFFPANSVISEQANFSISDTKYPFTYGKSHEASFSMAPEPSKMASNSNLVEHEVT
jgi:hypothetical protein